MKFGIIFTFCSENGNFAVIATSATVRVYHSDQSAYFFYCVPVVPVKKCNSELIGPL